MELSKTRSYKKDMVLAGLSALVTMVFVLSTNPRSLSAVLLLIFPMLVSITAYTVIKLLLDIFSDMPHSKVVLLSAVLAAGPTLIVVLGSLGQLGIQDIGLALLLVGGLGWYARRMQSGSTRSLS